MYYDAHTHLNDDKMFSDRKIYLQNFIDIGGKGLINVGTYLKTSQRAVQISKEAKNEFDQIFVSSCVGIHPLEVCEQGKVILSELKQIRELYINNRSDIVAIGECGLDYHYDIDLKKDLQKDVFAMQCDLAIELALPIVIHSRDAWDDTWDIIKNYKNLKVYFHCWGYGAEQIQTLRGGLQRLRVGFCGNITYPKAEYLRESFLSMRGGNILMETDAPYLSPQSKRGTTNESANLVEVYEYCADLMGIQKRDFAVLIENNFKKLYIK